MFIRANNRLLIFFITILIVVAGVIFLYQNRQSLTTPPTIAQSETEHIVEMRKSGFYPQKLTIKRGDRVTFVPVEEGFFWPASDPHPTHYFLDEFDPQKSIESGESWSFTFQDADTWHYHNHLSIASRGTIIVLDETSGNGVGRSSDECKYDDELRCFDEEIRSAIENGGIDAAFALFKELFESRKAPASCHWTAHLIGEETYRQFRAGKDFTPTAATKYCTWGFFHGFMETLLRDDPDPDKALEFCQFVGRKLGGEAQDNCYHGIGHGFTEDPPPQEAWGNPEKLIERSLGVCENLFGHTQNKWEICSTGAYSVLVSFMAEQSYGFSLDREDPFSFCREQPERYQRYYWACYGEIAPRLDSITGWDVSKITNYTEDIEDRETVQFVVRVASAAMMQRDVEKDDLSNYIRGCQRMPEYLRRVCVDGVVWGLLYHGQPEKEYIKALEFCGSGVFSDSERGLCYEDVFSRLKRKYSPSKMEGVCEEVNEEHRARCEEPT